MGKSQLIHIPFIEGQREDIDKKVLPLGALTRAKNVRLRKDGRWGVRYGDTALALTTNLAQNLTPSELIAFDDRLFALGETNSAINTPGTDLCEFVDAPQFAWKTTNGSSSLSLRSAIVAGVRDVGRPPSFDTSVDTMDVAATNGLVCLVWGEGSSTRIHIFRADTDATLLLDTKTMTKPRVVAVGDTFFIGGISGTTIDLYSYDPTTDDALQTETDLFGSGDAIVHWDFCHNGVDTGAWGVVHRSTPATSIREINSSGTIISTFPGPAVALNFVTINKSANRVNLAVVVAADDTIDLYSYTTGGVQSPASETSVLFGATTQRQVGIVDVTQSSQAISITAELDQTVSNDVQEHTFNPDTGVSQGTSAWLESTLGTKPAVPLGGGARISVFGGVQTEGSFAGNFLAMFRQGYVGIYKDRFTAGSTALDHLPSIAYDITTGRHYWPNLVVDEDGQATPVVTEFALGLGGRRHTVDMGGQLYLFGGCPQIFDTRQLVEAGYQETPVIHGIAASNGAGSLPSNTTLNVVVKWEWHDSRGNKHESALSEVAVVTMGASDDTIAFKASTPHSLRVDSVGASNIKAIAYRSLAGKKQLRRALAVDITFAGNEVDFELLLSDAAIATNEVVYTQGGRGVLGDVLEHESPLSADYATRFGKRILSAGGANPYQWQVSKPEFPGEPINWNGDGAFLGTIPARIYGVAALDTQAFIFSKKSVYTFGGDGPDETGQGKFTDPIELPGALGLHSANSLVETPLGIMYQSDEEKIALIPTGASSSEWFGQAVRDTLKAFPVVTAAVVCPGEQLVSFACNDNAGTDGRLIHYDLRGKVWIVDEFDGSTPITSIAEYRGRLARLSEGVITLANATHPPASFIDHGLTTGPIRPFGDNAWGKIVNITLLGEFRGNCVLTCLISYDDGKSWTTLEAFNLSTADGLVAGDAVRRQWWPRRRKGDRFMLEFRATALSGAASEGFVFNEATLGVMGKGGETRLAAGKRG